MYTSLTHSYLSGYRRKNKKKKSSLGKGVIDGDDDNDVFSGCIYSVTNNGRMPFCTILCWGFDPAVHEKTRIKEMVRIISGGSPDPTSLVLLYKLY